MTMGELAAKLGIDAPYATLVVDELERQGLVERRPHPTDRRAKLVATTDKGVAVADEADEIMSRPPVGLAMLKRARTRRNLPGCSSRSSYRPPTDGLRTTDYPAHGRTGAFTLVNGRMT